MNFVFDHLKNGTIREIHYYEISITHGNHYEHCSWRICIVSNRTYFLIN